METRNIYPEEKFATREAKGDNFYKIMIVNTSLDDYAYKEIFPWSLWIGIDVNETSGPFSMPTDKESSVLNALEDLIESILKKHCQCHFVGRITHSGQRDVYFYIDSPGKIHEELQKLIESKLSLREFQYVIEEDKEWKQVDMFYNY